MVSLLSLCGSLRYTDSGESYWTQPLLGSPWAEAGAGSGFTSDSGAPEPLGWGESVFGRLDSGGLHRGSLEGDGLSEEKTPSSVDKSMKNSDSNNKILFREP